MEGTCKDCVFPLNEGEYKNMYCEGVTSLMHAAYTGRERCVNDLLHTGSDVNRSGADVNCIGTSVNQTDVRGQTALIYAVQSGLDNTLCAHLLLNWGADVNKEDANGQTALLYALKTRFLAGYLQIMRKAGASVNHADLNSQTPLLFSCQGASCDDSHVKIEPNAEGDVNENNESNTPLYEVTEEGEWAMVKILIKAGADVNHITSFGESPLMLAGTSGHFRCVDLLLEAGADVNRTENYANNLLLETLCNADEEKKDDCVNYTKCLASFLKAGAAVNYQEKSYCNNPLQTAISMDHFGTTPLLVKAGADLIREDWDYGTPLMRASEYGWVQGVRLLLSAGADVNMVSRNSRNSSWSPLWSAVKETRINTVRVLLDAGSHIITQSPFDAELNNPLPFHLRNMQYKCFGSHTQDEPLAMLLFAAGASPTDDDEDNDDSDHDDNDEKNGDDEGGDEDDDNILECLKFQDIKYELKHMCREAIRRNLMKIDRKRNMFLRIPKLGLPPSLSQYLLYHMSLYVKPHLKFDADDDCHDNSDNDNDAAEDSDEDDGYNEVLYQREK